MSERRAEDGWIEWAGGKRPVTFGAKIEWKIRAGDIVSYKDFPVKKIDWEHDGCSGDIVAYRVVTA